MKLKQEIIERINNVETRKRIIASMDMGDQMLYTHLKLNKTNGRLTKMDALMAISKEVGLGIDDLLTGTVGKAALR